MRQRGETDGSIKIQVDRSAVSDDGSELSRHGKNCVLRSLHRYRKTVKQPTCHVSSSCARLEVCHCKDRKHLSLSPVPNALRE